MNQGNFFTVRKAGSMDFEYNDGGRSKYFKAENVRDCVTRAIAIATERDYKEIYNEMAAGMKRLTGTKTARNGISKKVYHKWLLSNGWSWQACMEIGKGCKVHLKKDELPAGTIIVRLSRHLACVKNGVIHDTYDCSRGGNRCVYGYYYKSN